MTPVRTAFDADAFAHAWISAWNAHDVDAITGHYHHDIEYSSPFVAQLHGTESLSGRDALREYVAAGLDRYPDLYLGPIVTVAVGVESISIVYWSVNDLLAVETLVLDDDGRIIRAHCHYRADVKSAP
jgi:hypothetical protein